MKKKTKKPVIQRRKKVAKEIKKEVKVEKPVEKPVEKNTNVILDYALIHEGK